MDQEEGQPDVSNEGDQASAFESCFTGKRVPPDVEHPDTAFPGTDPFLWKLTDGPASWKIPPRAVRPAEVKGSTTPTPTAFRASVPLVRMRPVIAPPVLRSVPARPMMMRLKGPSIPKVKGLKMPKLKLPKLPNPLGWAKGLLKWAAIIGLGVLIVGGALYLIMRQRAKAAAGIVATNHPAGRLMSQL